MSCPDSSTYSAYLPWHLLWCDRWPGVLRCVEMGSVASVFGNVLLAALQNANGQCGIKGSGPLRGDEVIAHVPLPCPLAPPPSTIWECSVSSAGTFSPRCLSLGLPGSEAGERNLFLKLRSFGCCAIIAQAHKVAFRGLSLYQYTVWRGVLKTSSRCGSLLFPLALLPFASRILANY